MKRKKDGWLQIDLFKKRRLGARQDGTPDGQAPVTDK